MEMDEIKVLIEGLLPYTERHYQRMARLQQVTGEGGRESFTVRTQIVSTDSTCSLAENFADANFRGSELFATALETLSWFEILYRTKIFCYMVCNW